MSTKELTKEYNEVVTPALDSNKPTLDQYIDYRGYMSMNNVINSLI